MAGTIYVDDIHRNERIPDYNIAVDIPAAQRVFNSSWSRSSLYNCFYAFRNQSKHVQSIIDSYTIRYNNGGSHNPALKSFSPETGTSTTYDVLAASFPSVFTMVDQELPLVVTDEGFILIKSTLGKQVNVSMKFLTPDPYISTELIGLTVLDSIIKSENIALF